MNLPPLSIMKAFIEYLDSALTLDNQVWNTSTSISLLEKYNIHVFCVNL